MREIIGVPLILAPLVLLLAIIFAEFGLSGKSHIVEVTDPVQVDVSQHYTLDNQWFKEGYDNGYKAGLADSERDMRDHTYDDWSSHDGDNAKYYCAGYRKGYDAGFEYNYVRSNGAYTTQD